MRPGTWAVAAVVIAVAFVNLGAARLWDRDEPRNAQCAREMMEAGDWIVPTFNGELRSHKPAMLYWGQIVAYQVFGVSEFAARVPSALAGVITVALVYFLAFRLSDATTANWAALLLGTMLLFVMASRAATPDSLLIATTTAVISLFVFFSIVPVEHDETPQRSGYAHSEGGFRKVYYRWPTSLQWAAIHGLSGLAVLAKGPVGFVMPMIIIGATLTALKFPGLPARHQSDGKGDGFAIVVWGQRLLMLIREFFWIVWQMRPVTSISMLLLVAGPWYFAVGVATEGEWLREFFLTHNYSRAVNSMEGHGGPPILYYAGAFLVGTFPWSCFAIPIAIATVQGLRAYQRPPLLILGVVWVGVFIGVFSFAATKLPSYISPCYPGAALVFGWYFRRILAAEISQPRWIVAALSTAVLIGIFVAIAITTVAAQQLPEIRSIGIAGIMLAVGAMIGITFARRQKPGEALRSFVIGAVGFVCVLHGWGPAAVDRSRQDLDAIQAAVSSAPSDRNWYSELPVEPSWVFYSNARIHPVANYQLQTHENRKSEAQMASKHLSDVRFIERAEGESHGSVRIFMKPDYFRIWNDSEESRARLAAKSQSLDREMR